MSVTCLYTQTTAHISQLLEQADGMYKLLVQHRNELDGLLTTLASGMQIVTPGRSVCRNIVHVLLYTVLTFMSVVSLCIARPFDQVKLELIVC